MELIRQLKNNMSTELWIELQVQRNIMRREVKEEMNRLIDRAITKMAVNMEATYGHIITKALNKLTVEYKVHSDDSEDDSEDELPSEESSNNNNNKKQATEKNVNAANASASTTTSTTTPANASNGNANAANASASTTTTKTTPANAPNGNANAVTPTTKTNATFVVVNGTTGATPITTAATTPAQINRPIANCKTRIRVVAPNSGPQELINLEEGDDLGGDDDDLGEGDEEEDEEEEEDGGDENSMAVLSPVVTLVTADNNDEQFDDDGDDDEAELSDAAMYDNSSVMKSAVVRANGLGGSGGGGRGLGGSGLGGSGGGQLQLFNHQQHQLQPLQRTLPGLYNRKRKIPKMTINTTADSSNESSNYIRFGIRCPVEGCEVICDFKAELDQHMLEEHGVNPYVCVLRGCSRSFSDITQLVVHQNNTHKALTTWPCKDCPKEAENCNRLTQHFYTAHYQRIYRCSLVEGAEGCDFIASTRREALRHFQMQHAAAFRQIKASRCQKAVFTCPYNGCGKVFSERTNLRTHKRFHSRSKPFGCSWPQCRYLSEDRANAIRHIRVRHLRLPATVKEQTEKGIVSDDDPRQWLQIYNEKF